MAAQPISGFQYGYDADGEVTSTIIQKQFAGTVTRTMSYDAAGQLVTPDSGRRRSNYAFAYDPASNRTSEKIGSAPPLTYTYNNVNQLTSPDPGNLR